MRFVQEQLLVLAHLQVFWDVFVLLFLDLVTGIYRARAEDEFIWKKVPGALIKGCLYFLGFLIFLVPNCFFALSGVRFPLWSIENVECMWLVVLKEAISVLQNIKGYLKAKNKSNVFIDFLINFLRLNVFHIVLDKIKTVPSLVAEAEFDKAMPEEKPETTREA